MGFRSLIAALICVIAMTMEATYLRADAKCPQVVVLDKAHLVPMAEAGKSSVLKAVHVLNLAPDENYVYNRMQTFNIAMVNPSLRCLLNLCAWKDRADSVIGVCHGNKRVSFGKFVAVRVHENSRPYFSGDLRSDGLTNVFDKDTGFISGFADTLNNSRWGNAQIGPQLPLGVVLLLIDGGECIGIGCNGGIRGASVERDGVEQSQSTSERKSQLQLAEPDNILSALGHALLRGKILYFTLAGFLLTPFVSLGLFWIFEYSDRDRKRRGVALLCTAFPLALGLLLFGLLG